MGWPCTCLLIGIYARPPHLQPPPWARRSLDFTLPSLAARHLQPRPKHRSSEGGARRSLATAPRAQSPNQHHILEPVLQHKLPWLADKLENTKAFLGSAPAQPRHLRQSASQSITGAKRPLKSGAAGLPALRYKRRRSTLPLLRPGYVVSLSPRSLSIPPNYS